MQHKCMYCMHVCVFVGDLLYTYVHTCRVSQLSQNAVDIEAEEEKCKLAIKDVQKERVAAIAALTQLLGVS